jgi:hypothetical protein
MRLLITRLVQSCTPYYEQYTTRQTTDGVIFCIAHRKTRDIRAYAELVLAGSLVQSRSQCHNLQTLYIPIYFAECKGLKEAYYSIVASLVVYFTPTTTTRLQTVYSKT